MERITSRANPRVQRARSLRESKFRRETGCHFIEGDKLVREALFSGVTLENVFVREGYAGETDFPCETVLVTDSMELAEKVSLEVERQLSLLPREAIARKAIEGNSQIIVTDDLLSAVEAANELAPWMILRSICRMCAMPARSSWASIVRNRWAITLPVRITRCRPPARRASPAR